MSKPLPVGKFRWTEKDEILRWEEIVEKEGKGCILEVDLIYPKELHVQHKDFPLAPEPLKLGGVVKLTQNLRDKKRMVLHGENLRQYLSLGMKLKKIRRGLIFEEKPFMQGYIDKNTKLRMQAKNAFENDFFKLMNNSVFGKTMENIRKRVNICLTKEAKEAEKLVNRENFDQVKIFDEFLIAVKMKKTSLHFDKSIFVGMSILDLSKTLMNEFFFSFAKTKWKKMKMLYTDTDSLFLEIETDDFFAVIAEDVERWFDTSDFPKHHPSCTPVGKKQKVIGKFKDECGGKLMTEFVALRPKCYSFLVENGRGEKKAKGVKKCVAKKQLRHQNFVDCLRSGQKVVKFQNHFVSHEHKVFTEKMRKISLARNDDKVQLMKNHIDTLPLGFRGENPHF